MKKRSAAEIIAMHFSSDIQDIREGRYQNYSPVVYVVGDDYYCSPANGVKPTKEAPGEPWEMIAEYYERKIYVSRMKGSGS